MKRHIHEGLRKCVFLFLSLIMCLTVIQVPVSVQAEEEINIALNRPVTVSGVEGGLNDAGDDWRYPHLAPEKLTDGDTVSRWSSDTSLTTLNLEENPDQNVWAYVDLGEERTIGRIEITWDTVASRNYDIQISNDAQNWETLQHYEDPDLMGHRYEEILELSVPKSARYVRLYARLSCEYLAEIGNPDSKTWYSAISVSEIEVYESTKTAADSALDRIVQIDPVLSEDGTHILLPDAGDEGVKVTLFGTSNPAVIDIEGNVTRPLNEMKVNVFYQVEDSAGNVVHSDEANSIIIPGIGQEEEANACPDVVPSLREWKGGKGEFTFANRLVIQDESLRETAEMIQMYFEEMLGTESQIVAGTPQIGDIYLVQDESVNLGNEGYTMEVDDILTIASSSEKGLLYGGTSVTQILYQDEDHQNVPKGMARDYPQYEVRAIMLDVGRIYIPLDYVEEISKYAAYFKVNEIRIHLNDDSGENGGAFRLQSEKYPALNEGNPTYSKADYKAYQKEMKKFGVDIVSEIDTPSHSMLFRRVVPELMLGDTGGYLDVTNPKTVEFVKSLFDEYLEGEDPVFQSNKVHIGTDEYSRDYNEYMRAYMNELITYITDQGLEARMWASLGTNGFDGTTPVSTNATVNLWNHGWASWKEMLDDGYRIINNADAALYVVPEGAYNNYLNIERLFDTWEVSDLLYGNHLDEGHPQLVGAEAAFWYDGANGQSQFDVFDRVRDQIVLISEKTWHGEKSIDQSGEEFVDRVNKVDQYAPQSNPARYVKNEAEAVAEYQFDDLEDGKTTDTSGNGYDAFVHDLEVKDGSLKLDGNGYLSLPFDSLGYPYSVSFDLTIDEQTGENAIVFSGKDGTLYYDYEGSGKFVYERKGYLYTFDFDVPLNMMNHYTLTSDARETKLFVNGYEVGSAEYYKQTLASVMESSSFVLPTETIGKGIIGELSHLVLYDRILSDGEIIGGEELNYRNVALFKETDASSVDGGKDPDGNWINQEYLPEFAVDGDRGTKHLFARTGEDEYWFTIDLGKEYLIDEYLIRFMEIPVSYRIMTSSDGEHWEEAVVRSGLNGRATMKDGAAFDHFRKVRYVKYEQLEGFLIEGYGIYSGWFNEFEVYGFEADIVENTVAQAKDLLEGMDAENDDAFMKQFRRNVETLENYAQMKDLESVQSLTLLVQKQIKEINEGNVQEPAWTDELRALIEDQLAAEDDFYENDWEKYCMLTEYGNYLIQKIDAIQEVVDDVVNKIEEMLRQIPYVSITSDIPLYTDPEGYTYELRNMVDGDNSTGAWFTNTRMGNYIQFKFREPQMLHSVSATITENKWDVLKKVKVEISMDKESWTEVGYIDFANSVYGVEFEETQTRYVRFTIAEEDPGEVSNPWADIGEVMFNGRSGVDRYYLSELLQEAKQLDDQYTASTWNDLNSVMQEAETILNDEYATQRQIDDAEDQLQAAMDALQAKASDSALNALQNMVGKANALESDDEALNTAIETAQALLDDLDNASATAVVGALLDLSEAMQALNTDESTDALRADVQAAIDFINENILNDVEGLRPGKVQALKDAVKAAQTVVDDLEAAADELKAANKAMTKAAQELWEIVSKAELNALIEAANGYLDGDYTAESLDALQAAIDVAQAVASNDDATVAEVTEAIMNLSDAIAGLEAITLDTSALEHEIELISEMIANIGNYVPSTVEGLQEKLDAAKETLENAASKAEIDEATKALREARLNARTKADVNALEELIVYVNGIDLRAYTAESADSVLILADRALVKMNDPEITQEEVDALAEELQSAIDALQPVSDANITTPDNGTTDSTNADTTNTAAADMSGMMFALMAVAGAASIAAYRRKRS